MKTIGIISEYNPFHNGHAYQIAEIKKRTGADYIVIAMSGDFVQRGAPAIIDKYARTKMALSCGADLVLELPTLWATSSAESFAMAGVTLFEKMGCIDGICFGAETDNLPLLASFADILITEPTDYKHLIKSALKSGASFPKARADALCTILSADSSVLQHGASPVEMTAELSATLLNPNNILALEYLKALKRRHSSITPLLLKREGAGYHDIQIDKCHEKPAASATAIRQLLFKASSVTSENENALQAVIPPEAYNILCSYLKNNPPLWEDDFSSILGYLLLLHAEDGFSSVADTTKNISNRMQKNLLQFDSFSGFCARNKSRDITYTRMSRILTHLLLGLANDDYIIGKELDYIPYLRILGFRRGSSALLRQLKQNASVPLLSKLADAPKSVNSKALFLLKQDIFAANLYEQIKAQKTLSMERTANFQSDYCREILRL